VPLNGLAGLNFMDAVGPPSWRHKGVFARLAGEGMLSFPVVPASRYVLEMDLEFHKEASAVRVHLAEPSRGLNINLDTATGNGTLGYCLATTALDRVSASPVRRLPLNERVRLKLVRLDDRCRLFFQDAPTDSLQGTPADLQLQIVSGSKATAATIHRCSFRPVGVEDVREIGWQLPPAKPVVDIAAARKRLEARTAGLKANPVQGKRFIVGTTGRPMAWIAPGEFDQGSRNPNNQEQERKHRVRLTKGFWMGEYEVSQGEWQALRKRNPSRAQGSPYLPVDWVSWQDAMRFCEELTRREKEAGRLPEGYQYRLPTEAEWEYACRAGSEGDFSTGHSWNKDNSGGQPHEIGAGVPNAWGLYDMHGNVSEWCADAWHNYPKDIKVVIDPYQSGDQAKDHFVIRGGAWWTAAQACRSSARDRNPSVAGGYRGFRVVLGPTLSRKK
jgi:formylglycine-generating enzyme required for sulfatase activity